MPAQKKYSTLVLSHWYTVIDGAHFSAEEFYKAIEDGLRERKVPGLRISRVTFLEGSIVSDKRLYLRLSREQFAFDLCAAPFGRAYFFSLRFVEKGKSWFLFAMLLLGVGLLFSFATAARVSPGQIAVWGFVTAIGVMVLGAIVRSIMSEAGRGAQSSFPRSSESTFSVSDLISKTAVIGNFYDRVRRDTYYRYDTRLMYHRLISDLVKNTVAEVTAEKGVELRREWDYSPLFDDLYRMKTVERQGAGVA